MDVQLQPEVLTLEGDPDRLNAEAYRLRHSDPTQGARWAKKAYALAEARGDQTALGRALYLLTLCRYIQGVLDPVDRDLRRCLEILPPAAREFRAETMNLLAQLSDRQGRFDEAVVWYKQAQGLYSFLGHASGLSSILNNLTLTYQRMGRWAEALEAVHESVAWAERVGAPTQLDYPVGNLARILFDLGLTDQALVAVRRALAAWAEGGDESHRGTLKVLLGECLTRTGDLSAALGHLLSGLAIARRTRNLSDEGVALRALGRLLHQTEDYERAALFLRRAVAIFSQTREDDEEKESLAVLGENAALRGRWDPARAFLEAALTTGRPPTLADAGVHRLLSRVEEGRGDFEASLRHLQTHIGIMTRLRHDEARAYLTEIAGRHRLSAERDESSRLRHLAETDPLTGVANRGRLDQDLAKEFDRAQRFGRPLSLLMIDLDHFKEVNDQLSHQTGDAVLATVARLLRQGCRQADIVGRYGGDEFQMILVETTEEAARGVADNLLEALVAFPWSSLHPRLAAQTVGIGVGSNADCGHAADLVARADADLYRQKRSRAAVGIDSRPILP